MRAIELQALGDLAGEAVGGTAARIEEMHTGVAGRAFGAVGAAGHAFPPVARATLPVKAAGVGPPRPLRRRLRSELAYASGSQMGPQRP